MKTTALILLCSLTSTSVVAAKAELYGTLEPFAKETVYFLLTDRFVDGDPTNNFVQQGLPGQSTFNRPLLGPDGRSANIGYLGGDFKGIVQHANYIKDLGFSYVWTTPIVDNPDYVFTGGEPVVFGTPYGDGGKTGYHGYWGINFYQVDEHLESADLNFAQFTAALKQQGLGYVLDVVANHGSPAYSMPKGQVGHFGLLFDQSGRLVADHQNLPPQQLSHTHPLHQFYNKTTGLAQLSDLNENNPAVLDYLVNAHLKWIEQGASAIRIDTIKEMPHHFWKKFTDKIRQKHPDIFIFAESFNFEAEKAAEHTWPENGGVSVLDFPGRNGITSVFEHKNSHYSQILNHLHLDSGVYANPYELMTFYDNHDMARMNASDQGFINANNWLFTSRGIPVIYYGSEINFMTGEREHTGNRNYLGAERLKTAAQHPVHQQLKAVIALRNQSIALQRGLQLNLDYQQHTAAFLRLYQRQGQSETALVLLNKSDQPQQLKIPALPQSGSWHNLANGQELGSLTHLTLEPHSVQVWINKTPIQNTALIVQLSEQMKKLKL